MLDRRAMLRGASAALAVPMLGAARAARELRANAYGAKGDGRTEATKAVQAAIDAAAAGGGTVALDPGTYLTGALFVKSGVTLRIDKGVTLRGMQTLDAYPMLPTRIAGIEMRWPAALINIYREHDAAVVGEGTIDGDGKIWWDSYWALRRRYDPKGLRWAADYDCRRPRLIQVFDASGVRIGDGLTLTRSGFWTVHLCYSHDVTVSGVTIRNNIGGRGPSTDGIDIDSSNHVLVEKADISCNDDALCLKAGRDADGLRVARPCENVVIRDCIVRDAAAGLTFGSETSGGIRNIEAYRLRAEHPVPIGLLFKSAKTRGGVISGIDLHDIALSYVRTALMINLNWNPSYSYAQIPAAIEHMPDYWKVLATPVPPSRGIPSLENVAIRDFRAVGANTGFAVQAYPEKPLRHFRFDRLDFDVKDAGEIANAVDWRFTHSRLTGLDGRPPAVTESSRILGL
jgi:polygalacturonase